MVKNNYHKHLKKAEVYDIVARYLEGDTQKSIAEDYDVTIKLIYQIVHLKIYKEYSVEKQHQNYWDTVNSRSSAGGRK